MQILYGYSNCTDQLYEKIVAENHVSVLQPDQKYHGLMIKGFARNGAKVRCYSGLPINRAVTKRLFIHYQDEEEENVHYHYYNTLNLPVFRQLMIFLSAFFSMLGVRKEKDTYAICDCLNIANAYGLLFGAHLRKIPVTLIVTDLPDMMGTKTGVKKINNRLFKKADGFIFLTEAMNERLNHLHRPYIVMEGHVDADSTAPTEDERYETETGKKVIIYAGSLRKLYGIQNLVEGFLKTDIDQAELWIYGDGDYADELRQHAATDNRIKYMGVRGNPEIVREEQRAALLVNPRPAGPEYTRYSFPSKNMEYMVSGTPVLTTRLPGMPESYYPYIYLLDDETAEGIKNKLEEIFAESPEARYARGADAREYVLKEKTNVTQTGKIMKFLETEINHG